MIIDRITFFLNMFNEQKYRLMVSVYRRPWTSTPEASQVHCNPLEDGVRFAGEIRLWAFLLNFAHLTYTLQFFWITVAY